MSKDNVFIVPAALRDEVEIQMKSRGLKFDDKGEIVTNNRLERRVMHHIINCAADDVEDQKLSRSVFRLERPKAKQPSPKLAPTPVEVLCQKGMSVVEGQAYLVCEIWQLSFVQNTFMSATAALRKGHGWRLFVTLDPTREEIEGRVPWCFTISRADTWPQSDSEQPATHLRYGSVGQA